MRRRPWRGLLRRWLAVLLLVVATTGCAVHGLEFVQDTRMHVVSPRNQALVRLPFTIRWTMRDFRVKGAHHGSFAVFIDQAPIRPGQTLRAVAANDPTCLKNPHCPNAKYLAARQIYVTTHDWLTLRQVFPLKSYENVQLHEATIILLDSSGHRESESAWYVDFRLRQRTLT
jgi:hypothetical protein